MEEIVSTAWMNGFIIDGSDDRRHKGTDDRITKEVDKGT